MPGNVTLHLILLERIWTFTGLGIFWSDGKYTWINAFIYHI